MGSGQTERASSFQRSLQQHVRIITVILPFLLVSFLFQIKVWTANPQQFVEDEDDDTFSYTVRIAAQDLLLV